jgi:hypothetical protein
MGRKPLLSVAFAAVLGLGSVVTINANADEVDTFYDPVALNTSCGEEVDGLGKADSCRFEPATRVLLSGPRQRLTGDTFNCTAVNATKSLAWSQATTEESSIQVSATAQATLAEVFSVSVSTTFGASWSFTTTETATENAPVPGLSVAHIERSAPLQQVTGRMVINYPKRRHGHFEWYTYPTVTTLNTAPDGLEFDRVFLMSVPMTPEQLTSECGLTPQEAQAKAAAAPASTEKVLEDAKPSTEIVAVPDADTSARFAE